MAITGEIRHRTNSGSGLVMSVAGLWLLAVVAAAIVTLILHIGVSGYYKDKLNLVARQAAQYGAGELAWAGCPRKNGSRERARTKAIAVANDLLTGMGLPAAQDIEVTSDAQGLTVHITVAGLAMPQGTVLPAIVTLSATATKSFAEDRPPGYVRVNGNLANSVTYMPMYFTLFGDNAFIGATTSDGTLLKRKKGPREIVSQTMFIWGFFN